MITSSVPGIILSILVSDFVPNIVGKALLEIGKVLLRNAGVETNSIVPVTNVLFVILNYDSG